MNQIVINGDNIEVLKTYPDNYFDAVVTDPPYGLGKEPDAVELMKDWIEHGYHEIKGSGFMGKEWDAFVPQPLFWKEVCRVLKHGGHVVSFFGTRTYDWGVMAMRFAGFEVRDCIQWLYGSGFPKSHNISKAIDKMKTFNVEEVREFLRKELKDIDKNTLCNELGITSRQIDHWIKENESQPQIPSKDKWELLKKYFTKDVPNINWENLGKVIDEIHNPITWYEGDKYVREATTEQAKEWEGWGSALKPANEPIVLARKPLEKGLSIAENVLKWGTGGINIDGCRVTTDEKIENHSRSSESSISKGKYGDSAEQETHQTEGQKLGRFPANLILTHHPECECKGLKVVKGSIAIRENSGGNTFGGNNKKPPTNNLGYADENGEETIEDWNCHPDCPIRIMDEQSGILKSGQLKSESYTKERVETNQGRFPANIILTHHPECECKGFKKVKSDAHHTTKYNGNETLYKGGWKDGEDFGNKLADENGEETIEDWECHPDCPIKIMDEQSGILKSGDMNGEYHGFGKHGIYGKGGKTNSISYGDKGGASRFFYVAKASKSERNKGLNEEIGERKTPMSGRGQGGLKCKNCNKWKNSGNPCNCENPDFEEVKFDSKPNFNGHPTVKPVKLMKYLVRLITPPNGKVLDPFCGSGTTGIACKLEGFEFVGIEQDPEYTKIAEARINNWVEEKEEAKKESKSKEPKEEKKTLIQQNLF